MVCIGIDLGTTYSCVAIIEKGRPRIIYNEEGNNFTPSIVSYGDNSDILVGNHALNYSDLSRVLYDSRRLLGWEFMYDLPIAENRLLWTFDLDTRNESVGYVLNRGTAKERFILPEEVSADILRKLKLIAESYTEEPITGAVVAIPAFFQTAQIEATKRAVQMAGLELKMLVKEPTAAAIAYNEDKKLEDSSIMIFNFGGGTLDINICEIKNGKLTIKAVHGDKHLGGQDFDGIIMNYVLQEYMELSKNDIFGNKRLVKRLRTECRLAKEALSFNASSYNIHLDIDLDGHLDLNIQLTKEKFNELCEKLHTRTSRLIDDTLRMANLRTDDIDHVILVGGSTRIPAIKSILEMKFGQEKLKFNIHPDEVVVFGAAIVADAIEKEKQIPLINNTMTELSRNINNLQIGEDNSFNNSHEILFYLYYRSDEKDEGRICLFNPYTRSVEEIAKFHNYYAPYEIVTTQNKIFAINNYEESFEIYDLNTRQISRGPVPSEWRNYASVAYFKDKLYYLGGQDPETSQYTNRVNILIDGKWQTGPAFPLPIRCAQAITCDGILYVIDGRESRKIYRLSDNEREWIKIGEILEERGFFGVASLKGRIYITGGVNDGLQKVFKSCLCFDPSAPVNSRISRIADMNYARHHHSLIITNGKLYAIGGYKDHYMMNFCNSTEEYDPQTNKWHEVGEFMKSIESDIESSKRYAIGIDLGTTRCCVATVDNNGRPQTILNDLGHNTTPSWILYDRGEVKVGLAAINAPSTGKNLIYDSKRLIGRQFNDECVAKDRAGWSFDVVRENGSDEQGKAMIKITEGHPGEVIDRLIAPEEASGELLKAMKQYAESHLGGQKVTDAVITMPAHFYTRQREATERAAQYAGFTNVQFLTEPTAAAIALAMKEQETNRTILIYDLGGGTFDVSIGRITNQELEILAIGGNTHLGGQDFDELIVKDFIAHFKDKHKIPFPNDKTIRRRLRNQCRDVKQDIMGIGSDLTIDMTFNVDGINYSLEYKINRIKFNTLCEASFRCTMAIIDDALCDAKLSQDQIDDILIVGGSTRIPRIRELIREKFPRAAILRNVNPDEAIAIGAAIYAAQLGRNGPMLIEEERAELNMIVTLSTPTNAEPTRNEQTASSNPIELENIVCIGIDLGTTFSCVAVMKNDLKAIPCDNDQTNLPCCVGYDGNKILVGLTALQCGLEAENLLYDSKRLIGWNFLNDSSAEHVYKEFWPFKVDTQNNCAGYILKSGEFVNPEEVSAKILASLKSYADKYLKKSSNCAVVTIPAQFSKEQRDATIRAGKKAGFTVVNLLEEPIASALAYKHQMKLKDSKLLIIDFGGGTLDISIVEIKQERTTVKVLVGHPHLGGQNIDDQIMKHIIDELRNSPRYDFCDPNARRELRTTCRERKEALATTDSVIIELIPNSYSNNEVEGGQATRYRYELTQEKLDELCENIFAKMSEKVDKALKTLNLSEAEIDHVILVGGSTRIVKVRQIFIDRFGEAKVKRFDIDPNSAVAFGAAIVADSIEKGIDSPYHSDLI